MPDPIEQGDLFADQVPEIVDGTVIINGRCTLKTDAHHRVVLVGGIQIAHYALDDRMAEAFAMVSLVDQGWADQNDVAQAFGCATRTLRRYQERFAQGGLKALGNRDGYPTGRTRMPTRSEKRINDLKAQGLSNVSIAKQMGVTEKSVRKTLKRLGWKSPTQVQDKGLFEPEPSDPNLSAFSAVSGASTGTPDESTPIPEPKQASKTTLPSDPNLSAFPVEQDLPSSSDTDPADRRGDRLFAYMGLLNDAAPLFRSGQRVPGAGVLLSIPSLVHSGIIESAKEIYGEIGPAFYGLRTTIVALVLLALLRIKRPEALKEHSPNDLGRLLGLDRAPEVKTLRRKLTRLSKPGFATAFGRAFARRRIAARGEAIGFLYVDGHVRVYHGKREISKAHVAQMRLCMPATTDYWVNDANAEPLFVMTAEANDSLMKILLPILAEARSLIGERRVTVVFDRGGWSPKLFQKILAEGFDILTYRKNKFTKIPKRRFHLRRACFDGRKVKYRLADQSIRLLRGKLRLRQVTRLSDNGHQTPIVTSRQDIRDVEVAYRMFERWRQENFFKYMCEEYALDALSDHQAEKANPFREVPNPKWKDLTKKMQTLRAAIVQIASRYGIKVFANNESVRRTVRGFKIANAKEGRWLMAAIKRHLELNEKRKAIPKRVPVKSVVKGDVVKLATERKHLTNILKMVAYQIEGDLVRHVTPHYKRAEQEGRTLIQAALASPADIEVRDTELLITLIPQSSPHRSAAVQALCKELNGMSACFPGTKLRMRFGVAAPTPESGLGVARPPS